MGNFAESTTSHYDFYRSAYRNIFVVIRYATDFMIWPAFKLGSNESKAIACLTLELLDFE